ncbi:caspase-1-B-like [Discoglossus pictus]
MAEKLRSLRLQLINSCNRAMIEELLDHLLHQQILSKAEVESIMEENNAQRNKCRDMVDMVIRKGDMSSNILLQLLQDDPMMRENLGLQK